MGSSWAFRKAALAPFMAYCSVVVGAQQFWPRPDIHTNKVINSTTYFILLVLILYYGKVTQLFKLKINTQFSTSGFSILRNPKNPLALHDLLELFQDHISLGQLVFCLAKNTSNDQFLTI